MLGEFSELSARLATTINEWHNTDTGGSMHVDSPDWISVGGQLERGAQADFQIATVPHNPAGNRIDIYGREGTLSISGGSVNSGPNNLRGSRGSEPLAPMDPPARYRLAPPDTPSGAPRNVAQAYLRLAESVRSGSPFQPDFEHAVRRHKLIEAIERSAARGQSVSLQPA